MRQDSDRSAAFFEFLAFLASWLCHGYVMATSRFSDSDISDTSWCQDLDMLHDVEVLGRSLVEALEPKLKQSGALAKSASNTCKILQNSAKFYKILWDILRYIWGTDRSGWSQYVLITFYYLVHFTESKRNSGHRNSTCSWGLAPALEFWLQVWAGKMWSCAALERALVWHCMRPWWSWSRSRWEKGNKIQRRIRVCFRT